MYEDGKAAGFYHEGAGERDYSQNSEGYCDRYRGQGNRQGRFQGHHPRESRGFGDIGVTQGNDSSRNLTEESLTPRRHEPANINPSNGGDMYLHAIPSDTMFHPNGNEASGLNRTSKNYDFNTDRANNEGHYYDNHSVHNQISHSARHADIHRGEEIEMTNLERRQHCGTDRHVNMASDHLHDDVDDCNELDYADEERIVRYEVDFENQYYGYNGESRDMPHAEYERSDDHARLVRHQPDLVEGHNAQRFEMDEDYNDGLSFQPKLHRAVSQRRSWNNRRERRREFENVPTIISFEDGMKTLIQRRKSQRLTRPRSDIVSSPSRLNRLDSGSLFGSELVDNEDEEEKLPSNRNYKRKALKSRLATLQQQHHVSAHDMAALLR